MISLKNDDSLKLKLIDLVNKKGFSIAAAARKLGVGIRNSQEFFAKEKKWAENWWNKNNIDVLEQELNQTFKENIHAKILTIDVETAPLLGNVWSLWNNNVGLNQLERDWYLLSFAAKWFHEDEVIYEDKSDSWNTEDDTDMLKSIWKLLDEADIVVTQNGIKFDQKKINARFIMNGMKPPSHYRSIDTCQIAKRHFGFTSNKLEYMTDKINKKYKKLKHERFAGFDLWKECLRGNIEAWSEMEKYNIFDVLSTEELYTHMRPWYKAHPNLNLYHNENFDYCKCGNDQFEHSGYHVTNLSKFDKFTCTNCGAEMRGRVNLLIKDKRDSLKSNII